MRSKQPFSAVKPIFVIFITLLLVSALIPTQAQARKFKVLHTFHGPNGNGPVGVLTRDSAGNLYGTTSERGAGACSNYGCGTAFKLDKTGKQVWLHSFKAGNGRQPMAGLLRRTDGTLYGTTVYGGGRTKVCPEIGCGTVFKLDSAGKETVLYKFKGTPDGFEPEALLAQDAAGNLYGATTLGGGSGGLGTVFQLDSADQETPLYSFTGGSDGCFPDSVIFDAAGNLYGAAGQGGGGFCNSGFGVVFELDTTGRFTVLHTFGITDGAYPEVSFFDSQGNLYGATGGGGNSQACGSTGCGTIFKLSPQRNGDWTETVLYNFCSLENCADGEFPSGLVRDSSGNIYGITARGGAYRNCNGDACGVVFKLDSTGNETVLHSFTGGADGAEPSGSVAKDSAGNLYGTAFFGGSKKGACAQDGCGVVFKLTP